jgi:hypothetical protein
MKRPPAVLRDIENVARDVRPDLLQRIVFGVTQDEAMRITKWMCDCMGWGDMTTEHPVLVYMGVTLMVMR